MWGPDRVRKRSRGRYSGKECKNKTKEKKKRGERPEDGAPSNSFDVCGLSEQLHMPF